MQHDVMRFAKIAVRVWGCPMDLEHPERTAKAGHEVGPAASIDGAAMCVRDTAEAVKEGIRDVAPLTRVLPLQFHALFGLLPVSFRKGKAAERFLHFQDFSYPSK